jgi:methylated-DNA-[protein]-cysteine S-methyltransferase
MPEPRTPVAELGLASPVGPLTVVEREGAIVAVRWGEPRQERETPLLAAAKAQIDAYFYCGLRAFELPLKPAGAAFDQRVWQAMLEIPYGETRSYGELAGAVGGTARAVGTACARNPIPIIIPCHRVVAADGPGGYSGEGGLVTKHHLLALERRARSAAAAHPPAAAPSQPTIA